MLFLIVNFHWVKNNTTYKINAKCVIFYSANRNTSFVTSFSIGWSWNLRLCKGDASSSLFSKPFSKYGIFLTICITQCFEIPLRVPLWICFAEYSDVMRETTDVKVMLLLCLRFQRCRLCWWSRCWLWWALCLDLVSKIFLLKQTW